MAEGNFHLKEKDLFMGKSDGDREELKQKENLQDKKTEDEIRGEKNTEDKDEGVPMGRSDGNSEELKQKENLHDKKSEDEIHREGTIRSLSPKIASLIKAHPHLMKKLHSALKEREFIIVDEDYNSKIMSYKNDPFKFLEENNLTIIPHDSDKESWLKENEEWKNLIDSAQNKFACVIFSEEDFSKTYVCTTAAESELILSEISKFLDQNPSDIKISSHVMEFVRNNKKFSDLNLEETAQDGIWIRGIRKPRLAELKEETKKVICQSYLLDENQYMLLRKEKKEVLSHFEKKFQVKGSPYQLPIVGDIPVVFQVNPLISISCVEISDPENIPVDSLISVDWKTPQSTSDYDTIEMSKIENYNILEKESWNLPMNHHITLLVPDINKGKTSYSWNLLFEKCLKIVSKDDTFPHTIGISIPTEMSEHLVEFCQDISTTVTNLPQNHNRPIYILLFVKSSKMMKEVIEILKTPASANSDWQFLTESEEFPVGSAQDECTVEVIKGLITEQKVDVVATGVNKSLDLNVGPVLSALSRKAGPGLQKDCTRRYPNGIIFPEIAFTKGYNLICDYVFYGALPQNDGNPNICTFVENCLEKATENNLSSIAFSALGIGNMEYKPLDVASQMASAIVKFKTKTPKSFLKKIIIVIYPDTKGMDDFFELKNLFAKAKGAVPKGKLDSPQQNEQKQTTNWIQKKLQWIPFCNYSTRKETLDHAIMEFEKGLKNVPFQVSFDEAQALFFFYDLMTLVPGIAQQLSLKQENLLVPEDSLDQLQKYLTELNEKCCSASLEITDSEQLYVGHLLVKVRQQYPNVECKITSNGKSVLFKALSFEQVQEAKYLFKFFLGFRENMSPSPDQVNTNRQEHSELTGANTPASSSLEPEISGAFISNSKKNDIINYFLIEEVLVKVYKEDILKVDVDGIVNAANKWLSHGGGVAGAIIKAAGDTVNEEGQSKLKGIPLNDGEVVSTSAGNLNRYKHIIHAAWPEYMSIKSNEYCRRKITEAVSNSLEEANKLSLSSVALPAISSDIFGVPLDVCTNGYFWGVKEFCKRMTENCPLKEVHFVDLNPDACKTVNDYFAKQLNEAPLEIPGNNIQQSKESSLNLPNQGKPEDITKICSACFGNMSNTKLLKCTHSCCSECVKKLPQTFCRLSFHAGYINQPDGSMTVSELHESLPGFDGTKTYYIEYNMGSGWWKITKRDAFLPKNQKGHQILKMLQLAFKRQLIFTLTVKKSKTPGQQNVIWNSIHHKTEKCSGQYNFGYPDPGYLDRVTKELADKAITPDLVANKSIEKFISIQNGKIVTDIPWCQERSITNGEC